MSKRSKGNMKTFLFMHRKYFLRDNSLYIDSLTSENIIQFNIKHLIIKHGSIWLTSIYDQEFRLESNMLLSDQLLFNNLPTEIIDIIYDQLDLVSQTNFRLVSKRFSDFPLTNFWSEYASIGITNKILTQHHFIKYLNLSNNACVTEVENLIHLRQLNITNSNVTTLSNLPNLKLLMMDNDDVKMPQSDGVIIVKTKPFYSDYIPYTYGYGNTYSFAVYPQPYQLGSGYANVSRISSDELILSNYTF